MILLNRIKILIIFVFLVASQTLSFNVNASRPSVASVSEIGQQDLEITINRAIQTRRISEIDRLSKERGSQEEDELAHEITANMADYTSGETHESSIKNFIEKNFGF